MTDNKKEQLLDKLLKVWVKNPELRLMQLISNSLYQDDFEVRKQDIFFITDEYLIDVINKYDPDYLYGNCFDKIIRKTKKLFKKAKFDIELPEHEEGESHLYIKYKNKGYKITYNPKFPQYHYCLYTTQNYSVDSEPDEICTNTNSVIKRLFELFNN